MLKTKGHNMTFDECLEKLKSETAESKEIIERAEIFAELCNEYGIEVKDAFPRPKMDAIEFLQQYKLMCGQYNCTGECPIKQLLDKYGVDICDDAFIYLHPEEVVEAVLRWQYRHERRIK